ncbi:MAG: amino acid transporter, partial [Marmoricola sp.]|nr:amino acid transporter [Marmoricola sp.]
RRTIRLVAHEPDERGAEDYVDKEREIWRDHDLPSDADVVFVEVTVRDPSDFEGRLDVHGEVRNGRYRVLTLESPSVPNALASLALEIRDLTGARPHLYFEWTEGNPVRNFFRFLLLGVGEVAPTTREVLRRAEPDRDRRPHVHVG